MKKVFCLTVAMVSLLAMTAIADQDSSKEWGSKKVPEAVKNAFKSAYPSATIKGIDIKKEKEHGKNLYEIESVEGTVNRKVVYITDGSVYKTVECLDAKSLPEAIVASINSAYPKGKIKRAKKIVKDNTTKYRVRVGFTLTWKNIMVDETGKMIKK